MFAFKHRRIMLAGAAVLAIALVGMLLVGSIDSSTTAEGVDLNPTQPCKTAVQFSSRNFRSPTRINSRWLPLVPGTQVTLDGQANRSGTPLPHRVIFTVTDLTKV